MSWQTKIVYTMVLPMADLIQGRDPYIIFLCRVIFFLQRSEVSADFTHAARG